jgi:hypothetical protein
MDEPDKAAFLDAFSADFATLRREFSEVAAADAVSGAGSTIGTGVSA